MLVKGLEKYKKLYYSGNKEKDVIWLTALTSKSFSELYKLISQVLPEEKVRRFMEGAIAMSKDEFVLHEWNKELFDNLIKYNEIEDATNEGKALGIIENKIEIAKNMLKENLDIKMVSKVTGLTEKEVQKLKEENTGN